MQVKPEDGLTTMICKQCQQGVMSHLQTFDKVQYAQKSIRKYFLMSSSTPKPSKSSQNEEHGVGLEGQNLPSSSVQSTTLDAKTMMDKLRIILENDTVPTKKSKKSEFKDKPDELKFQKLEKVTFFHRFQREVVQGVILETLPRKRYSVLSLGKERKMITLHENNLKRST